MRKIVSMATVVPAVVVGRDSAIKEVSKDALRDVYLRRQRVWADGMRAIPASIDPHE